MNRSSTTQVLTTDVGPFFDLASDLMCILNESGCFIQVNRAFTQELGYSTQLLSDRALTWLACPDDEASIQEYLDRLIAGAPTVSFSCRCKEKEGGVLCLDWTISTVETAYGRQLYGVAKNNTQSNALQRQLAQQDNELSLAATRNEELALELTLVEQRLSSRVLAAETQKQLYVAATHDMPVGLYVFRLEDKAHPSSLRLIATNPITETFTGVASKDILGQSILDAFPALSGTGIPKQYADVVLSQQKLSLGEVVYGDDRIEKNIFDVKAFPLPDSCVGVVFDNITLHKKSEVVRHEQAAQLRVMFDQANIGMARISVTGQWIQANRYVCDLLGYSAEVLTTKNFFEFVHPEDRASAQSLYRELSKRSYQKQKDSEKRLAQDEIESRYVTAEGKTVWSLTTPSAVYDQQGELLYLIVVIQDITKRNQALLSLEYQKDSLLRANLKLKHAMQDLEQRNAELDQFAYVTSHDLKAPLRAIANLATWIEEDLDGQLPAENAEQLALLKNRVHRMEGLINGLLAYSRVGRTHQSSEQVDVAELLEAVVDSLPANDFTIAIAPNMPQLQTKRLPLFHVFSNLIDNAIKHHHHQRGRIDISAKDLGSLYQFTVADDGPGIEPVFHEKVFTIFQTLRSRDDLESTGIGLSIVKKTVLAEGGDIQILSPKEGGTAFQFTWPHKPKTDSAYEEERWHQIPK